jgi:hypothetical protein
VSGRGILIGIGIVLVGVLVLAVALPRLQPGAATPTPAPTTAPTSAPAAATAPVVAPSPVPSPTAATASTATPISATATAMPATATPVPATQPMTSSTPGPGESSWIGNRPLPPGPIPANGPLLQKLQDEGRPGVRTDQPGLGQELRDRFLAAMAEEDRAFAQLDDSRLGEFFTGEALEDLRSGMERERALVGRVTGRSSRAHRVMQFIPRVDEGYQVVDALTEKIDFLIRNKDGSYGQLVREGQEQRQCVSWTMMQEGGSWKLAGEHRSNGGVEGRLCPPGWS